MRGDLIGAIRPLAVVASVALASCAASPEMDPRSASSEDFAELGAPCSVAAQRIAAPVEIVGGLHSRGRPALLLTAGDMRYICRREADGNVSIFSELAL